MKIEESKQIEKNQNFDQERNLKGDGNIDCSWSLWNGFQRLRKKTSGIENQRKNQYHPKYITAKIRRNIERSPEDLGRLSVTQTSVRNNNKQNSHT